MGGESRRLAYPRLIAHRCGGALAPENSLAGLRVAAGLGIRGVEFDVMLSRDGVPILMHDETLERNTDGHGRVADHDLADLQRFHVRIDTGVSPAPTFPGERIPTLAEAWQQCAESALWTNVEIKPGAGREAETGTAVGSFLATRWREDAGVVSSFSEVALQAFAAVAPEIPRALLLGDIPADWPARLARNGCRALHCAARNAAVAGLDDVLAAGVPVACYTVNDREAGDRLLAAGVAALFTDRLGLW